MNRESRIYVAGHGGLVGSALMEVLGAEGYGNLLVSTRAELDLTRTEQVDRFFQETRPEYVFLAAARVGGIWANNHEPADFIRDNLAIELNVIDAAHRAGVKKLLFLGSSCIYPREAEQPLREASLLTGPLEQTNEWYAVAKIAGIKLCQAYRKQHGSNFISVMPTNLYGPHDNFDPMRSHVLPALIRRFHEATVSGADRVTVWGTGTPRREFLHVRDLANACLFLMDRYDSGDIINVGRGSDITIRELARKIAEVTGFEGEIEFDHAKPDGTPRKVLDVSRVRELGWEPTVGLEEGLRETYQWFVENHVSGGVPS